jgi:hypothetical protein
MQEVDVYPKSPERLTPLIGDERAERLRFAVQEARQAIDGATVWHINAIAHGGGVAEILTSTLLGWRSTDVARPEPPADANAAWQVEHDLTNEQWTALQTLGVDAPAERRTSRCSATVCPHCPATGDTRSKTSCRPAPPATPVSATTKSPAGSGESGSTSEPCYCATWNSGWHSR